MTIVDRFEGEWVVLVVDGVEKRVPRAQLPSDVREGDVLDSVTLKVDAAATQQAKAELRATREKAFAGKSSKPGGSI